MRKLVPLLMALLLVLPVSVIGASAAGTPFVDVSSGAWYAEAVEYVYDEGLFNGTSPTTFSPGVPMKRAELMQVLANRTQGYSKEAYAGTTSFADVPVDYWGCAPIRWAYRVSLADGVGNNNFDPEASLTREQIAVFLYRYAGRTGASTSLSGANYQSFPDKNQVSDWAVTAMTWAVNKGVINGSDGLLLPQATATRAQVAQMFLKAASVLSSDQLLPPGGTTRSRPHSLLGRYYRRGLRSGQPGLRGQSSGDIHRRYVNLHLARHSFRMAGERLFRLFAYWI